MYSYILQVIVSCIISITNDHQDHSAAHQVNGAVQVDASQEGTGDNHAISALKFKILQEFLELNWHVLLSDVDIVTLQVNAHSFICCKYGLFCHSQVLTFLSILESIIGKAALYRTRATCLVSCVVAFDTC